MDWADIARVMSTVPARIGRVESQGQGLVVGAPAHVTLVDATVRVTVDPAKQWTLSLIHIWRAPLDDHCRTWARLRADP